MLRSLSTLVAGIACCAGAAHAALNPIQSDGVTLIQDTTLGVMWVADLGLSGNINWYEAQDWIAGLNAEKYGGFSDWSLPTGDGTYVVSGPGYGLSTSPTLNQLGFLFYNELGNVPLTISNVGPFQLPKPYLLQRGAFYWSSSTDEDLPQFKWVWCAGVSTPGYQDPGEQLPLPTIFHAMAVRAAPVPEPSTSWMSLLGLGVLGASSWAKRWHRRGK